MTRSIPELGSSCPEAKSWGWFALQPPHPRKWRSSLSSTDSSLSSTCLSPPQGGDAGEAPQPARRMGRGSPKRPQGAWQTSPWPPEGSKRICKGGRPRPGSQRQSAQEPAQTPRCPWSVSEIPDIVTAVGTRMALTGGRSPGLHTITSSAPHLQSGHCGDSGPAGRPHAGRGQGPHPHHPLPRAPHTWQGPEVTDGAGAQSPQRRVPPGGLSALWRGGRRG